MIFGSEWVKGILQWRDGFTGYMSIPFSWLLPEAKEIAQAPNLYVRHWVVGGPAVQMVPNYFDDVPASPFGTRTPASCR